MSHLRRTLGGMPPFKVVSDFSPAGDQPRAIEQLARGIERGDRFQTLLGITGSRQERHHRLDHREGAAAHAGASRPTRAWPPSWPTSSGSSSPRTGSSTSSATTTTTSPRPTSRRPTRTSRRTARSTTRSTACATRRPPALLTRRDVIVVASVSCIYGLGSPEEYRDKLLVVRPGEEHDQRSILRQLVDMQYERNDMNLVRGKFRVRGDTIELHPGVRGDGGPHRAVRRRDRADQPSSTPSPASARHTRRAGRLPRHPLRRRRRADARAIVRIEAELPERLAYFEREGKLLEAQRLRMRTQYDLEMMQEVGFCSGIENYSAPHRRPRRRASRPTPCSTSSPTTSSW